VQIVYSVRNVYIVRLKHHDVGRIETHIMTLYFNGMIRKRLPCTLYTGPDSGDTAVPLECNFWRFL